MTFYIDVLPDPGTDCYILNASVIIEGRHIPSGYRWNGASIPKPFWAIIGSPFTPKLMVPSLVHDFDCDTLEGIKNPATHLTFHKLMLANNFKSWKARAAYRAVVLWSKFK